MGTHISNLLTKNCCLVVLNLATLTVILNQKLGMHKKVDINNVDMTFQNLIPVLAHVC